MNKKEQTMTPSQQARAAIVKHRLTEFHGPMIARIINADGGSVVQRNIGNAMETLILAGVVEKTGRTIREGYNNCTVWRVIMPYEQIEALPKIAKRKPRVDARPVVPESADVDALQSVILNWPDSGVRLTSSATHY